MCALLCLSVCSTHSWSWPSLCPASPRSSWQPRRPWGATAKSQSLKTIRANANDSQTSPASSTGLRMMTISNPLVFVFFPPKGHKMPPNSSQCFRTDHRLILPLCLVLKLCTAIMCFLFVAAIARVCCWCWHWLLQYACEECGIPVAKVQDSLHTEGRIHKGSYLQTAFVQV